MSGKGRAAVEAVSGEEVPRLIWVERRMAARGLLVPHMFQPGPPATRTFHMPWEFMGARRVHTLAVQRRMEAWQAREDRHGKVVRCRMARRQ